MSKPLVQDAGSRSQVKSAEMREKMGRERDENDLRTVLSTPQGRRFLWRMLGECRVFESIMDPSGSRLNYNAGQQDIGHNLQAKIIETDMNAYLLMQQEALKELNTNV